MPSTTAILLNSSDSAPLESLKITFQQKHIHSKQAKIKIDHTACPELSSALSLLANHEIITKFHLNPPHNLVSLKDISTAIKLFDNPPRLTTKEKTLQLQIAKTYLMKSVLKKLEEEVRFNQNQILPSPPPEPPSKNTLWRWIGFAIMMVVEFIPPLIGNLLLSSDSMASLTPYLFFIPAHIMASLAVVSALTMLGGMICFVVPELMKWIGLKYANKDLSIILNRQKQIDIAKVINFRLVTFNNLSFHTHQAYCDFSNKLTEQITGLNTEEKKEGYISKSLTAMMMALTGIQALSGALFLAATIIGTITGTFTLATASPLILTAFVSSHMYSVLALAVPLAISQGMMSYILRVSSTTKLFDPFFEDRKMVIQKRMRYLEKQKMTEENLSAFSKHKANDNPFDKEDGMTPTNPRQVCIPTQQSVIVETGIELLDRPEIPKNTTFRAY